MTLNRRERNIALGTGAVVVLGLVYWLAWQPYSDSLDALENQKADLIKQRDQGQLLLIRKRNLTPVWNTMRSGGLRNDASTAESQFYAAMVFWAQHARTSDPSFKTDPPKPDKDAAANGFQEVTFHVSVTGTLSQISDLLWSVETATIPLRVLDIQLTPKKDGMDSTASPLSAQISIATLSMLPQAEPTALPTAASASVAASGTLAANGG